MSAKDKDQEPGTFMIQACRCRRCGALSSNRSAADDNPMKLMSIALRPLCEPPFPLERIQEMTDLMGGDGKLPPDTSHRM